MLKRIKGIYNAITTLIVIVAVALVILLVGVRAFGLQPFTVLSGSMEPKFHVGSIIYVKDVDPSELKVGDPLTFTHQGATVTHEIIEIVPADEPWNMKIVTQGLTNNISDGEIPVSNIIGKPVFTIPYLGYVAAYLQNSTAVMGIVAVVIILLLVSVLLDFLTVDKKKSSDSSSVLSESPTDPDGDSEDNIKQNSKEEKQ